MNKFLSFFLISCSLLASHFAQSQSYGNEWIVYGQPYFKCKVYQDGFHRIPVSALLSAGLPAGTLGAHLQLFRDGVELPIAVSTSTALQATDYLEFYGAKANGLLEKRLYQDSAQQLNPAQSLVSDTSVYFITVNAVGTHLRFAAIGNVLSGLPAKETYCWVKQEINYRSTFVSGPSATEGQYQNPELLHLNLSQYEKEGYVKSLTTSADSVLLTCAQPYLDPAAPDALLKTTVVGRSYLATHNLKLLVNQTQVADTTYSKFDFIRLNRAVPMSLISGSNTFSLRYQPSVNPADRFGIVRVELSYPATFDAGNQSSFAFELSASATPRYLEISNFNRGNLKPLLYNLSEGTMQVGDTTMAGVVRFKLPASVSSSNFVLQSAVSASYKNAVGLSSVSFKNFSQAVHQGNYLIVTDRRYANDGNGHDYVEQYRSYRSSAAGGANKAMVAYTDDLYNEFGYGYDFSSLALRNFLHYAHSHVSWTERPQHVFLIGKGLDYSSYLSYKAAPYASYPFYAVPTFGQPGSDLLLTDFSKNDQPKISTGRLSAFTAQDIKVYLDKVIEHEQGLESGIQTREQQLWRKRFLHIAGATDPVQLLTIEDALKRQKGLLENTSFGGFGMVLSKSENPEQESVNNQLIDSLMNHGVGIVQFFGHSSASTIDYGLDFPEKYTNDKRYPLIIANGCGAGNIFLFTGQRYLSERFLFTPHAGAIGFLAGVNTAYSAYLGFYTDSLYDRIGNTLYNKSLGEQMVYNVNKLITMPSFQNDFLMKMHTEQILLNGDPALKLTQAALPDYSVDSASVQVSPDHLHTGIDSIVVDVSFSNLGMHTEDSVLMHVRRRLADQTELLVYSQKIPGFAYQHTLHCAFPVGGLVGQGENQLTVSMDPYAKIAELSDLNNSYVRSFSVRGQGLIPVYPTEFSMVGDTALVLKASTLDPFADSRDYWIQIDTTASFNSPWMQSALLTSSGGILRWKPTLNYQDSVVYYWRTAANDGQQQWLGSSFLFIAQSQPGWNQSHVYQFMKDTLNRIQLDATHRDFTFESSGQLLQVQNVCMFGAAPFTYDWPDYLVKQNGRTIYTFGCDPWPGYSSLQFVVIDTLSGQPWLNTRPNPAVAGGKFGSFDPCRITNNGIKEDPFFEFSFLTQASRKLIMDFMDSIPQGYYVMIQPRLCVGATCGTVNATFVNHWKADTTTLGSGVSLYHKLKNMGFGTIDSFYRNRPMILWTEKGNPASVKQYVANSTKDKLYGEFNYKILYDQAQVKSPRIGPATAWSQFVRQLRSKDAGIGDSSLFSIYGITASGSEMLLAVVRNDTSLSFIDAQTYPYVRIVMTNRDHTFRTPHQMSYWRVHFTPVPEAALNPARMYSVDNNAMPNTSQIRMAVENLSTIPMDSLLVTFALYDRFNVRTVLGSKRYRPLPAGDTLHIGYDLNTSNVFSNMKFEVEVNPLGDQPEQFHPNNLGIRSMALIDPNLPLPLTLRDFTVRETDCSTLLEWSTSDEVNFSHFDLEKKSGAGYQAFAQIPARQTAAEIQYYQATDEHPGSSIWTYRLKMVDLDGKLQYSPERSIRLACGGMVDDIMLFPNPAADQTYLMLRSAADHQYQIHIVNSLGQQVYATALDLAHETKVISLPLHGLAAGIYSILVMDDGSVRKTLRLTKE